MALRDFTLPRMGETMETGRLVRWLKHPGDEVARGETILELETDKTIVELPSLMAGRLVEQIAQEGEDICLDGILGRMEVEGPTPNTSPTSPIAPSPSYTATPAEGEKPGLSDLSTDEATSFLVRRATPVARLAARKQDLHLESVKGSGRRGRIELSDVLAFKADASKNVISVESSAVNQVFDTPSGSLFYQDSGEGDKACATVILIHGFAGDRSVWAALASSLSGAGIRVITPDLPGHGQSSVQASNLHVIDTVMTNWLSKLAINGPLHVIAHSLGAVVATRLAAQRARPWNSLTLIAPAGIGRTISAEFIYGMSNAQTAGEISHLLTFLGARGGSVSDVLLEQMAIETRRSRLQELASSFASSSGAQRLDILRPLQAMATSLSIRAVIGVNDRVIDSNDARNLPTNVAVHYLAGSGHMPMWDQPRELLSLILTSVIGIPRLE